MSCPMNSWQSSIPSIQTCIYQLHIQQLHPTVLCRPLCTHWMSTHSPPPWAPPANTAWSSQECSGPHPLASASPAVSADLLSRVGISWAPCSRSCLSYGALGICTFSTHLNTPCRNHSNTQNLSALYICKSSTWNLSCTHCYRSHSPLRIILITIRTLLIYSIELPMHLQEWKK